MTDRSPTVSRRAALLSGMAVLCTPAVLRAAPRVLRVNTWLPRAHPVPKYVIDELAPVFEQVTNGRVTLEYLPENAGPPPRQIDMLREGTFDLGYSLHGYSGAGAFTRARIGQFSFLGDAYSASNVFSEIYTSDLAAAEEHEGVQLLGVFQHGPGQLFLKGRSVRGPEDFQGLRLRSSGGYIAQLLGDLGAQPIAMPPSKVREAMADGSIDGVMFPWEGGASFGILDQTTEIVELEGGFYNASWFLAMNPTAWGDLEEQDRAAVAQISAEYVHVLAAKAFDFADFEGRELFRNAGRPIIAASAELTEHVRTVGALYEQEWIGTVAAEGYDGGAALTEMRRRTQPR